MIATVFPHLGLGVYARQPIPKYFIPIVLLSIHIIYIDTQNSV